MVVELCMNSKDFKAAVNKFKERYPELIRWGINYIPRDCLSIMVYIPGRGKLIYEPLIDRITWLEHWTDEKEIKEQERRMRPAMYEQFRSDVTRYLIDHHMTQQQFADMVGLSRFSINRYLNGELIPKTSTMRQIYKIMNIDI